MDFFATPAALAWTFRLGQALGFFGYLVIAKYRKLASANLRIAFPEWTKKQLRKNGREHFQTVTDNLLCSLVLTQKSQKANPYIDISQLLAAAPRIKAASRVIWVINHIGNWEFFILAPRWLQNRKTQAIPRAHTIQRLPEWGSAQCGSSTTD